MQHLGTVTLTTDRLILRRFTLDDAECMYRNWASDPEVTAFLTWPTHKSVEVSKMVLSQWAAEYEKPDYYQWAIELKELGEPIGSIAVVDYNDSIGKTEVGYCIGKMWWHKGIVSEALKAVIDFLLDEVGAERVGAYHDTRNPHSGGVMKKCGMQYEGTLRHYAKSNAGVGDAAYHSILKTDKR